MKRWSSRIIDTVLVLAVLATTGLAWTRRSNPTDTGRPPAAEPIRLSDWRDHLSFPRRVGSVTAPFQVAVWSDYQCPACLQLESELSVLRRRLGDSLAIVYRYFPIPSHRLAFSAAAAAECARRHDKFSAMHDALFATELVGDTLPIDLLARRSGAFTGQELRACIADRSIRDVVEADRHLGDSLGLRGTPYLQIGDQLTLGGMPARDLERLLRQQAR